MRSMNRRTLLGVAPFAALLPGGMLQAMEAAFTQTAQGGNMEGSTTVYELRVYTAAPGKQGELLARFGDNTLRIFAKHGMKCVAFWTPLDEPAKSTMLYYILEHPSREAAAANWKTFQDDPEWKAVKAKSEANGKLAANIDSTFLTLTPFSPHLA
jgi:NIPSNAP protein